MVKCEPDSQAVGFGESENGSLEEEVRILRTVSYKGLQSVARDCKLPCQMKREDIITLVMLYRSGRTTELNEALTKLKQERTQRRLDRVTRSRKTVKRYSESECEPGVRKKPRKSFHDPQQAELQANYGRQLNQAAGVPCDESIATLQFIQSQSISSAGSSREGCVSASQVKLSQQSHWLPVPSQHNAYSQINADAQALEQNDGRQGYNQGNSSFLKPQSTVASTTSHIVPCGYPFDGSNKQQYAGTNLWRKSPGVTYEEHWAWNSSWTFPTCKAGNTQVSMTSSVYSSGGVNTVPQLIFPMEPEVAASPSSLVRCDPALLQMNYLWPSPLLGARPACGPGYFVEPYQMPLLPEYAPLDATWGRLGAAPSAWPAASEPWPQLQSSELSSTIAGLDPGPQELTDFSSKEIEDLLGPPPPSLAPEPQYPLEPEVSGAHPAARPERVPLAGEWAQSYGFNPPEPPALIVTTEAAPPPPENVPDVSAETAQFGVWPVFSSRDSSFLHHSLGVIQQFPVVETGLFEPQGRKSDQPLALVQERRHAVEALFLPGLYSPGSQPNSDVDASGSPGHLPAQSPTHIARDHGYAATTSQHDPPSDVSNDAKSPEDSHFESLGQRGTAISTDELQSAEFHHPFCSSASRSEAYSTANFGHDVQCFVVPKASEPSVGGSQSASRPLEQGEAPRCSTTPSDTEFKASEVSSCQRTLLESCSSVSPKPTVAEPPFVPDSLLVHMVSQVLRNIPFPSTYPLAENVPAADGPTVPCGAAFDVSGPVSAPDSSTSQGKLSPDTPLECNSSASDPNSFVPGTIPDSNGFTPSPSLESDSFAPKTSPESNSFAPDPSPEADSFAPKTSPESNSFAPDPSPEADSFAPKTSPESNSFAPEPSPEADRFAQETSPESNSFAPDPSPEADSFAPKTSPESNSFAPDLSPEADSFAQETSPESSSFAPDPSPGPKPDSLTLCARCGRMSAGPDCLACQQSEEDHCLLSASCVRVSLTRLTVLDQALRRGDAEARTPDAAGDAYRKDAKGAVEAIETNTPLRRNPRRLSRSASKLKERPKAGTQIQVESELQVDCLNRKNGCRSKIPADQLSVHQQQCRYKILNCPCPPCDFCGVASKLYRHLRQVHRSTIKKVESEGECAIKLQEVRVKKHVFCLMEVSSSLYVIGFHTNESCIFITIQCVASPDSKRVNTSIGTLELLMDGEENQFIWQGEILPIQCDPIDLHTSGHCLIVRNSAKTKEDTLSVHVLIRPMGPWY